MNRLEKAAQYLEAMISQAVEAGEADDSLSAEARQIVDTLRRCDRKDLEKAVWASVFSVLKIKGDLARDLAMELEYAEGKSF